MKRATVLALLFVIAAAARIVYDSTFAPDAVAEPLRISFTDFPLDVAGPGWRGERVPLDDAVIERSGVTDYLNQHYSSGRRRIWVYAGYVSGYSPDAIHYPDVCFPASGLELESKSVRRIPLDRVAEDVAEDVAMNEYIWRREFGGGTYTLSTFCYNGKFEPHEWRLRSDRIVGIRYFTIITISGDLVGGLEHTRSLYADIARRMIARLMKHLPLSES